MLKKRKVKANEQKSGHNGAETIYNRCVEEKSEERVIDRRKEREGTETSPTYSLMLKEIVDHYNWRTLIEYYVTVSLNDHIKPYCVHLG